MIYRLFVLFIFSPIFAFCSQMDAYYAESLVQYFQEHDCVKSLQLLDEWERFSPEYSVKITGMRAAVYFTMGNVEIGTACMNEFIENLSNEELSDPMLSVVLDIYRKTLIYHSVAGANIMNVSSEKKYEQPKGVKLKYWFGVGQILVGIIAAPFTSGGSTALIFSGITTVVDAAGDALDNKENWERQLNERQRTHPDVHRNAFYFPHYLRFPKEII